MATIQDGTGAVGEPEAGHRPEAGNPPSPSRRVRIINQPTLRKQTTKALGRLVTQGSFTAKTEERKAKFFEREGADEFARQCTDVRVQIKHAERFSRFVLHLSLIHI